MQTKMISCLVIAAHVGLFGAGCSDDGGDGGSTAGTMSGGSSSGGSPGGTMSGGSSSGGLSSGSGTGGGGGGGGTTAGGASGASASGGGGGTASGGGSSGGGAGGAGGGGGGTGGGGTAGGGGSSQAATLTDAQILMVLDALNAGEVAEAEAAEPRLTDDDVQAFAEAMIEEHGDAREQVGATASSLTLQPAPSPVQMQLQAQSTARVMAISGAADGAVDGVYIAGQIMAHSSALALLTELGMAADAQPLKDLVMSQRSDVQEHLDEAQDLDSEP